VLHFQGTNGDVEGDALPCYALALHVPMRIFITSPEVVVIFCEQEKLGVQSQKNERFCSDDARATPLAIHPSVELEVAEVKIG
jgi:hypothetical protein